MLLLFSGSVSGTVVTPGAGALTLTGYAPTVSQTANQEVLPGAGALTITGYSPVVSQSNNQAVFPGVGSLAITGYAPTVAQSNNQAVNPAAGVLTLTGYAPTVDQTANQSVSPGAGTLTFTGYPPSVTQGGGSAVLPDAGALLITGYAPTVTQTGGRGIGFEGNYHNPAVWWTRKPRKLDDEAATEKLAVVAKIVKAKANKHAEVSASKAYRRADTYEAVKPVIAEMPGFDWAAYYEAAYNEALNRAILAALIANEEAASRVKAEAIAQEMEDEAICLLLLMTY